MPNAAYDIGNFGNLFNFAVNELKTTFELLNRHEIDY